MTRVTHSRHPYFSYLTLPRVAVALVLGGLVAPGAALADPGTSCDDFPRQGLEWALDDFAAAGLDPGVEAQLDAHLSDIITQLPGDGNQITEGAVVLVGRHSKVVYHKAAGLRDGNTTLGGSSSALMPTNAIFDLESMTKPFTAAVLLEMDADGVLDLDDLVIDYLPDFEFVPDLLNPPDYIPDANKADVTIRDMLRYMGGLDVDGATSVYGVQEPYERMQSEVPFGPPGVEARYSDLTYRLLGHIAEVAYADAFVIPKTFRGLVSHYITGPLGMTDTEYEPVVTMAAKISRVAGTGYFAHYPDPGIPAGYRHGEVQDDQDWWTQRHNTMFPHSSPTGTGCDGLFSTAADLAAFAQVLIDGGEVWDAATCEYVPFLAPATVAGLTAIQTLDGNGDPVGVEPDPVPDPPNGHYPWTMDLLYADKAYGFELMDGAVSAGGSYLSGVFKTGGAGTFMLVDPGNDLFIIVLTNHGLPAPGNFAPEFDAMLEEIGPHRIADTVALAITDSSSS